MSELTADNATHLLQCSHCIGRNRKNYSMLCHVLKKMDDGRLKLLVFGERDWADRRHIKRVRYVDAYRVSERQQDKAQ